MNTILEKVAIFCLLTMAAISVTTVVSSHVLRDSTVFSAPENAEPIIGQ
jgi:hypothetical protein